MEMNNKENKRAVIGRSLIDIVLSWSFKDVLNKDMYKNQVKQIPRTFSSTNGYLGSYVTPLIAETHADLKSSTETLSHSLCAEVMSLMPSKDYKPPKDLFYDLVLPSPNSNDVKKASHYEPANGDLIAITRFRPKCAGDLDRPYIVASVLRVNDDLVKLTVTLSVLSSAPISLGEGEKLKKESLFAVYLINMTTNIRIWQALNADPEEINIRIIAKVLNQKEFFNENCTLCGTERVICNDQNWEERARVWASDLNESQRDAVLSCIRTGECRHENTVKLIWGPPGTGKTKTVGFLLHSLLRMKYRTLTCAPTNVAVLQVAKRLVKSVAASASFGTYGLGDVVLFGNEKRMNIDDHDELCDVFLSYRIEIIYRCLAPSTGWRGSLISMINLLEDPEEQYRLYLKELEAKKSSDEDDEEDKDVAKNARNLDDRDDSNDKIIEGKKGNTVLREMILRAKKENKKIQRKTKDKKKKEKNSEGGGENTKRDSLSSKDVEPLTFEEFVMKRFDSVVERLHFCIVNLYTHLPTCIISLETAERMIEAADALSSFRALLHDASDRGALKHIFSKDEEISKGSFDIAKTRRNSSSSRNKKGMRELIVSSGRLIFQTLLRGFGSTEFGEENEDCLFIEFRRARMRSILLLQLLPSIFPVPYSVDWREMQEFFVANSCLIFCTVSSSAKLHNMSTVPLELVVIDEAAQLKECESTIPLQLLGIRHAFLIGDERQLPAMVKSKVSEEADFGRSLFERLASLGHKKHLLNVQHRMHPSISLFPNREFYENKISDGPNVVLQSYNKTFLPGNMFGPYSFINVTHGNESVDRNHSTKNLVEVVVVSEIVSSLYKEVKGSKKKVRVGVISPYKAQVYAITEKFGKTYSSDPQSDFSVSVRSVDGFQGGEEDIIIISTVRSNVGGNVGFLSNRQRANVALTRARHCLWIVGNGSTLGRSSSVWRKLVANAKERRCFHEADMDKNLARAMVASLTELNQITVSPNLVSLLFRDSIWKVHFDDLFWSSMGKLKNSEFCKEVLSLIEKLSYGWRREKDEYNPSLNVLKSSEFVEHYNVKQKYLIWAVDTEREISHHTQILKVWGVLEPSDVPRLYKQLDMIYQSYGPKKMSRCKLRHTDGNLVVPMRWTVDSASDEDVLSLLSKPFPSLSLKDEPGTTSSASNRFLDVGNEKQV